MPDELSLTALLESAASHDAPMLVHDDEPVSFARVRDESRRVAAGLARLGVGEGDRVAIWLPTTPAWIACFFACARIGAIAVAVNTRFVARELADVVGRSGARVLIYWPGFSRVDFASILAACDPATMPALEAIVGYGEAGEAVRPQPEAWPVHPYRALAGGEPATAVAGRADSPCAIFTTSGTTKAPKFVLHDQRTLVRHATDVVAGFDVHSASVLLLAPPLCGVFGFCCMMAALVACRPLVTSAIWDAARAARQIDAHGVTHLHGTDDAIAQLLEQTARTPAFPSLEFCGYAAFNPAQEGIVARAQARGVTVVGLYGISEIQALFSRQPETAPVVERSLAGGRPVSPLARVRARDPESGLLLPHGRAGELEFVAPSSRMLCYFGDPDSTAAALTEDGWYRSGDLGYTQDDGRFVYLTRIGDSLRLGGFLVSPLEIESVVQASGEFDGCQVVGVDVGGVQRPVAFVVLAPGAVLDESRVLARAAERLARYKVPVRVLAIDSFPVTAGTNATKVQKHRLRELARERIAGAR